VFPENLDPEQEFVQVSKKRRRGKPFSFYRKGIKKGAVIKFIPDENIQVTVVGEREVEYQGKVWKLSPLVAKLMQDRNQLNKSEAYQGANYFSYQGQKLKDLPEKSN